MKTATVVLSGCGNKDGSEIRESVLTLLALDQNGVKPFYTAPAIPQKQTINHLESIPEAHARSAIVEAARIARGEICAIEKAPDADFLIIPGGLGTITTLCSYAENGSNATIYSPISALISSYYEQKKPIVALCIAPVLIALALKKYGPIDLTLGKNDTDLAMIENLGMNPVPCDIFDCVVDKNHRIISTPAYMGTPSLQGIFKGITKAIQSAINFL